MLSLTLQLLFAGIALACGPGYNIWEDGWCFKSTTNNYYYIDYFNTSCAADGAHLPSVHSAKENANILRAASQYINSYSLTYYLGLKCDGQEFRWNDGTPFDYENFAENYTCTSSELASTVYVVQHDGTWLRTSDNSNGVYGICQSYERSASPCDDFEELLDGKGDTESCLKLVSSPATWNSAQSACSAQRANLAVIHDQTTNDFIRRTAVGSNLLNGIHIGLSQGTDGNYTWTDGSDVDYDNFAPGFPQSQYGSCVAMQTGILSGEWMNTVCYTTQLPYMCTKPAFVVTQTQPAGCPTQASFTDGDDIYSPSFPAPSGVGACDYIVLAPGQKDIVELTVQIFETNLCCDTLTVYDGLFGTTLIDTLSGQQSVGRTVRSNTNAMRLHWNATSGSNTRGFHLTVAVISL